MLDENMATTMRPFALVKISSNPSVTSRSDPLTPLRSTFVLSPSRTSAGIAIWPTQFAAAKFGHVNAT